MELLTVYYVRVESIQIRNHHYCSFFLNLYKYVNFYCHHSTLLLSDLSDLITSHALLLLHTCEWFDCFICMCVYVYATGCVSI